jgi:hypothetical protein
MDDLTRRLRRLPFAALLLVVSTTAVPATAGSPAVAARMGLELAREAAQAWSADARLVYVENDESLDATGRASRWGYLFHSPALGRARVWSVRDGRIVTAENLDLRFDAPPVGADWLDSDAALAAAEKGGGGGFRREFKGRLATMLLMRGVAAEGDPEATTWTFVYGAPGAPSLYVVVDAATGRVRRAWRS